MRIITTIVFLFAAMLMMTTSTLAADDVKTTEVNKLETFQEQMDFFKANWLKMQDALNNGGGEAAVEFINETFRDDMEKRVMYAFARMGMVMGDGGGPMFDDYITVCDAGIAECLRQAEEASDEETKNKRINAANVISYNLGADLAFCWEDSFERTEDDLKRGLQAGLDCIKWRKEIGNPPMTLSMAYWLTGIHYLALNDNENALKDFEESLKYAEIALKEEGQDISLEGSNGSILIGHGWVALTKMIMGSDAEATATYEKVMDILKVMAEGDDEYIREDAKWYIMQLEKIHNMYLAQ